MTIADSCKPLNFKKGSIKTNRVIVFYSVLLIPDLLILSFFLDSKHMWHCLCAYCIVGDNVYGLGKLVLYGSIFILCSFFSQTFFGCLRPSGKDFTNGEEIIIFWN